jgi:hypothetical protein
MARYKIGQGVKALALTSRGTTLGPGTVTAVEPREDGGQRVTVMLTWADGGAREQTYNTVGKAGRSDSLLPLPKGMK